jgi:hypothetical protein
MRTEYKKIIATIIVGLGLGLAVPAGATDYRTYSLEELNNMRGKMATASTEERASFRSARQEKMEALNHDERLSYKTGNKQEGGAGNGNTIRTRDGSGSGSMHHYSASTSGGGMHSGHGHGGRR